MGSYENLPNTEFSIEQLTMLVVFCFFPEFDFRYVGKSGGVPRVVWKGRKVIIIEILKDYGCFSEKVTWNVHENHEKKVILALNRSL